MERQPQPTSREQALLRLLDDPSPVVREALRDAFLELGQNGFSLLRQTSKEGESAQAAAAAQILSEIADSDTRSAFIAFIQSFNYELETGSFLLDRTVFPEMDPTEYCLFLDTVAARCRELIMLPSTAWEQCKQINRVLFHEYGFRGDSENYYNPLNSYLHQVIHRRRGIPLSLSILYILVAERCDLGLEPIALPGHFLVGCFNDEEPFFIDPFTRGVFRSIDDVKEMMEMRNIEPHADYLMPSPAGEVLCRVCRNLVNQYSMEKNEEKARFFREFVKEFEATYARHANS